MSQNETTNLKRVVAKLPTKEFEKWMDENAPTCPMWQKVRGSGITFKDIGTLAYVFLTEKLGEE